MRLSCRRSRNTGRRGHPESYQSPKSVFLSASRTSRDKTYRGKSNQTRLHRPLRRQGKVFRDYAVCPKVLPKDPFAHADQAYRIEIFSHSSFGVLLISVYLKTRGYARKTSSPRPTEKFDKRC